ncbi:MAG: D-glycero-beta-D-manno-heptose-7-phosphate kinase, partial [Candidatus Dadabacteria bacterium]|nr:D-glycero-beta-D-manno-heptose-7-phosphate kinase [Candidatus Dadabacteria bacterium]
MNGSKAKNILNGLRIIVIGDLMLDKYIAGDVYRTSPEAPVPVVNVYREYEVPGGAANVAVNIRSLGPKVQLFGLIGNDSEGKTLIQLLKASKINIGGIIADRKRNTTTKSRIIANNQQVVRIDKENNSTPAAGVYNSLVSKIKKAINSDNINAIVFSDYCKGVISKKIISEITKLAAKKNIFTVADPKGKDPLKYKGIKVLTPNSKEASELSGIDLEHNADISKAAKHIIDKCRLEGIVITRGKHGIAYRLGDKPLKTVSSIAKEVYDVTGAGDTVISTFSVCYLLSRDWEFAVSAANRAAGIVVSRVGTSSLSQSELLNLIDSGNGKETKIQSTDV